MALDHDSQILVFLEDRSGQRDVEIGAVGDSTQVVGDDGEWQSMVDGRGYPNVYISFKIVMMVTQISTIEALQTIKRYIVCEDAMLCCSTPSAMLYGRPALVT